MQMLNETSELDAWGPPERMFVAGLSRESGRASAFLMQKNWYAKCPDHHHRSESSDQTSIAHRERSRKGQVGYAPTSLAHCQRTGAPACSIAWAVAAGIACGMAWAVFNVRERCGKGSSWSAEQSGQPASDTIYSWDGALCMLRIEDPAVTGAMKILCI